MKSILYILISIFVLSIVAQAIPNKYSYEKEKVALNLQLPQMDENQLNEITSTISNRLKCCDIKGYELSLNADDNSLKIEFDRIEDYQMVRSLLTPKGELSFCETLNGTEVIAQLDKDSELHQLLVAVDTKNVPTKKVNPLLGYFTDKERIDISACILKQSSEFPEIQFAWGNEKQDGLWPLFSLRRNSAIDGSFVENSKISYDKKENASVLISFSMVGADLWAEMTQRNIGNQIAIVMDNIVYSMPVVQQQITGGKAMISGKLKKEEIRLLNAVIKGGALAENLDIE